MKLASVNFVPSKGTKIINARFSSKICPRSDETDLVARLKQGDESAFRMIVETRKDLVYNTALGLLQNAGDAEDITQEVFIKVYESVHQFKGESAFSTWLYRIAVTKSLEMIQEPEKEKKICFYYRVIWRQQ